MIAGKTVPVAPPGVATKILPMKLMTIRVARHLRPPCPIETITVETITHETVVLLRILPATLGGMGGVGAATGEPRPPTPHTTTSKRLCGTFRPPSRRLVYTGKLHPFHPHHGTQPLKRLLDSQRFSIQSKANCPASSS